MATLTPYSSPYFKREDRLRHLSLEQTLAQIAQNPDPPSQDKMFAYIDEYHDQLRATEYAMQSAPHVGPPIIPSPRSQHSSYFGPTSSMSPLPKLDFMDLNTDINDSNPKTIVSPQTEFINFTVPTSTSPNLPAQSTRSKKRKRKSPKASTRKTKTKNVKEVALQEEVTKDFKESPQKNQKILKMTKEQTEHFENFDTSLSQEFLRLQLERNKDAFERNKIAMDLNFDADVDRSARKGRAFSVPSSPVGFGVKGEGDEKLIGLGILGLERPATVVPRV